MRRYHRLVSRLAGVLLWTLLLLTAGLPLAWLLLNLIVHAGVAWSQVAPTSLGLDRAPEWHHLTIFARTLLLAAVGATLATLLSIAPAAMLARGGWAALLLLPIMAGLLVVPGPAWAYGWAESLRQSLGGQPRPQSWADYGRVALTNGSAWWPIPAAAIALAWRRLPAALIDTATLDGARGRIISRLLVGPALAGWAAALLLSAQNLSAPDLSGIVVASVIVRDTFQLGAGDQSARLAAATMVGLPSFLATAAVAIAGWLVFRGSAAWSHDGELSSIAPSPPGRGWPRTRRGEGGLVAANLHRPHPALRATLSRGERGFGVATLVVVLAPIAPPLVALWRTSGGMRWGRAIDVHGESLGWGLALAAGAAGACAGAMLLGTISRSRGASWMSLAAFLLGGQFLALGMIRAYNPPAEAPRFWADTLGVLYDTAPYFAAASIALFAWLPLAVAGSTWMGRWRGLRDLAAADGANALQTAAYVIWPLAWPGLLAATLAVLALSLVESQAAALLVPGTPINYMLSNLHTLNYPAMTEAALLMALVCSGATAAVVMIWVITAHLWRLDLRSIGSRSALAAFILLPSSLILSSCDRPPPPEAVWAETGTDPGQLAYPRAIAYSPADDTVWVVDKTARVQQFDAQGNYLRGWTMPEQKYGRPVGISTDSDGNVWVADTHYYRVIVYRPDGTEWFRFGEQGNGPGQFAWPTDVLVLDDGRVLVSEYGGAGVDGAGANDRIQLFQRSSDGTITDPKAQVIGQIGSFGTGEGEFRRPQSMAMRGEELWVTDGTNHRLLAFDLDGNFLRSLGSEDAGSAPGEFRFPYGLEVDEEGKLLVSEFGNHRVQKIDPDTGEALGVWGGSFGGRPGQVKYPFGLAHDSLRDRIILLDSGNDRMQVVKLPQ